MDYLLLLFVTIILFWTLAYTFNGYDILSPSVIFCTMFFLSISFALLNKDTWNIEYSFKTYCVLSSGILVFVLSEVFMRSIFLKRSTQLVNFEKLYVQKQRLIEIESWKIFFASAFGAVMLFFQYREVVRIATLGGYSGQQLMTYYRTITAYTTDASVDVQMNAIISHLLKVADAMAFGFAYGFVNNVLTWKQYKIKNYFYLIPVLLYVFRTFLTGARTGLLRLLTVVIVSSYILWKQRYCWKRNISTRYIKIGFILIIIILPLFYFSKSIVGRTSTQSLFDYISLYIGGSIQHFNQYIMDPGPSNKIWGQECFPNVYSFLWDIGIKLYKGNVYLDFRQLNNETRGNVYTFFRRPLQDFGLLGMYLFTFLVAVFFAYCYYKKISNHRASYRCDQRILFYSYCFYEIVMASIEQMCFSYVSIGTIELFLLIYIQFYFFTRTKFKKLKIYFLKPI